MPKLLVLAGNIASGKTTLLQKLDMARYKGRVVVVPEPVDEWPHIKASDGVSFFDKMYHNTGDRSAFNFQLVAITTRVTLLRKALRDHPEAEVFISERSATEDYEVFAQMFYDCGRMTADDMTLIHLMVKQWEMCFGDQAYWAYANTPPVTCLDRLHQRLAQQVRDAEAAIKLDYLEIIDATYQRFLSKLPTETVKKISTPEELDKVVAQLLDAM